MKRIFVFLLPLFFVSFSMGQYHLSEVGLSLGGGATVPFGFENAGLSYGLNGGGFFSHWVCGKRYGYHGVLGVRNFHASGRDGLEIPPETIVGRSSFSFNYLDLGFFFKVRRHEYHRWYEAALLVGPKIDVLMTGRHSSGNLAGRKSDNIKLLPVAPGIHASLWIKRKFFAQALYIQPGVEYYPLNIVSTPDNAMSGLYAFLNIGFTFWNTKQTGFKSSK